MTLQDSDVEVVDGALVLAGEDPADVAAPRNPAAALRSVPKRQVLALIASSFVCGAATVLLSSKNRQVKITPRRSRTSLPDIIGSDRYLIDVHKLRP